MNSAVAIVLGATISGVIGVLVVIVQQRLTRRHELDMARVRRLSEFSAAGWAGTVAVGNLALAPLAGKVEIEDGQRFQGLMDRFNSVLAQIQLLDDDDVYVAAHHIDECLVRLMPEARARQADRNGWRTMHAELTEAVAEYQRAARRALGSPALDGPEPWRARAKEPEVPGA